MALFNPFKPNFSSSSFSTMPVQNSFLQLTNTQLSNIQKEQLPKFNEQQFFNMLPSLTDNHLQHIVAQARLQGISEKEIEDGLTLIQQLRQQK